MRASIINTPPCSEARTIKGLPLPTFMAEEGVQRTYAPTSICFGCGPANEHGLQIDSYRIEGGLKMEYMPEPHHQAFPGMVNGGIIGTLLDCHGNWTAAIALMDEQGLAEPPCTVTATYDVQLRRPTPMNELLVVTSQITEILDDRVRVKLTLEAGGNVCATGSGLFVAVKEGHPAYHRWS
ncbi:MAG: PaaI family thioesterase [Candidatus Poseidoniales archaeon]